MSPQERLTASKIPVGPRQSSDRRIWDWLRGASSILSLGVFAVSEEELLCDYVHICKVSTPCRSDFNMSKKSNDLDDIITEQPKTFNSGQLTYFGVIAFFLSLLPACRLIVTLQRLA